MMVQGMGSLFAVLGVVGVSHLGTALMEYTGHGDKTMFVKIVTYAGCAYIAWEAWWRMVRYVQASFNVYF
ncbi:hypothetical protein J31TS4_15700 [Paenibacillus sp. J31TS4]|uniref:hypothetical protein n=1 Tax=Paenibacillus sp. J31TS4 TaxID=2807195 RepID=UPI001B1280E0|nr:hypothetical protein [Paenibacillus sp. J31TS4]GIP38290.1 hypothetical protein J31TS4_15700 [Paenibacillus sp. J31TS4]